MTEFTGRLTNTGISILFCQSFKHSLLNLVIHDNNLLFKVNILNVNISETVRASSKCQKLKNDFCRFEYLPMNDTITKVTPNDLDLLF